MIRMNNFFKEDPDKGQEIDESKLGTSEEGGYSDPTFAKGGETGDGKDKNKGEEGSGEKGDEGGDEFKPDPAWDTIKGFIPEDKQKDFTVPEDLSKDNEHEKLREAMKKYVVENEGPKINPNLHPLAADLQREFMEKGENFDINDWNKKISSIADVDTIKNTSVEDLIKQEVASKYGMKTEDNPDGLTDADLDEYVKGLNKIEKMEKGNMIRQAKLEEASKYKVDPGKFNKPPDPAEIKQEVEKQVDNIFKAIDEEKTKIEIGGVDISKALKDSKDDLIKAFVPNEEGIRPIDSMLQSDENFLKFYFLNTQGGDFFSNLLSDKSMRMKMKEYIEKLDDGASRKGSFNVDNKGEIDESVLGQPG